MPFAPRVVSTEALAHSVVFDVERLELEADGATFHREVVRHRGAVAVLAVDVDGLVLVRQWRAPLAAWILEVPAGTCDVEGEDLETTARRELEEEAGIAATSLEWLCDVWNSPGWSDQRTVVFLATGLRRVTPRPSGPEEESIEVVRMHLEEAVGLLDAGGTVDATTALAIRTLAARAQR